MKRLAIITVGKTHSGKTTFARALEKELYNSMVIDQDNHAEFINTYYKNLQQVHGPNILKYAISRLIVNYAIEQTDCHLILCNSNRSRKDRSYLIEELFPKDKFIHIIVHFDILYHVLQARVTESQRSTNIFRGAYTNFAEVLNRQQADSLKEDVIDPVEEEAEHLFVIKDNAEAEAVILEILRIARH
ncbi:ATP-binding protein [Mesobacillus boroniphilus]|uniref:ATP-binding protein n=1 Tax=Mesobacillus boroniphilus TaxID=308892 RepID=A0A944GWS6_9BACI|nr:AAA family ATPase [Mesobacillus boroniphilus]MBS8263965.1 ATP-binding protein [Mesobacillus boroniphilus]